MTSAYDATGTATRKRLNDERARLLILIADERDRPDCDPRFIQSWLTQLNIIIDQINRLPG